MMMVMLMFFEQNHPFDLELTGLQLFLCYNSDVHSCILNARTELPMHSSRLFYTIAAKRSNDFMPTSLSGLEPGGRFE
jgi:hypothetical protein